VARASTEFGGGDGVQLHSSPGITIEKLSVGLMKRSPESAAAARQTVTSNTAPRTRMTYLIPH
jgi:hypothetical protein